MMVCMSVGTFTVVVLDRNGRTLSSVERTSRCGCPRIGEEIMLDGSIYVVERVVHEDDPDDRTVRRYIEPRVIVRLRRRPVKVLPLTDS